MKFSSSALALALFASVGIGSMTATHSHALPSPIVRALQQSAQAAPHSVAPRVPEPQLVLSRPKKKQKQKQKCRWFSFADDARGFPAGRHSSRLATARHGAVPSASFFVANDNHRPHCGCWCSSRRRSSCSSSETSLFDSPADVMTDRGSDVWVAAWATTLATQVSVSVTSVRPSRQTRDLSLCQLLEVVFSCALHQTRQVQKKTTLRFWTSSAKHLFLSQFHRLFVDDCSNHITIVLRCQTKVISDNKMD